MSRIESFHEFIEGIEKKVHVQPVASERHARPPEADARPVLRQVP